MLSCQATGITPSKTGYFLANTANSSLFFTPATKRALLVKMGPLTCRDSASQQHSSVTKCPQFLLQREYGIILPTSMNSSFTVMPTERGLVLRAGIGPKNGPGILAMATHHYCLYDMWRHTTYQRIYAHIVLFQNEVQ